MSGLPLLLLAASLMPAPQQNRNAPTLPKFSARVKLTVAGPDFIKDQVISYVNRELRSLGDVVVTDENAQYELRIVGLEVRNKAKVSIGVALSVVSVEPLVRTLGGMTLQQCMEREKLESVFKVLVAGQSVLTDQWLYTGGADDIPALCREIVASFDTESLEPARKAWQKVSGR